MAAIVENTRVHTELHIPSNNKTLFNVNEDVRTAPGAVWNYIPPDPPLLISYKVSKCHVCAHSRYVYTGGRTCAVCSVINPAEDIDFLFMDIHRWIRGTVSLSGCKKPLHALKHTHQCRCNPERTMVGMIGCIPPGFSLYQATHTHTWIQL